MESAGVLEKLLTQTAPVTAFVVGLLFIIYRLGALYITQYFSKVVPIQERSVVALERLSTTAETVSQQIGEDLKILAASNRAVHWDLERLKGGYAEGN